MLLGVSASARIWGNCETAVKSVLLSARRAGARTAFVRLTDINIKPCRGCFTCLSDGGTCPLDDDLYNLLRSVRSADSLILAAPVYFMAPPASLLLLLDRLLMTSRFRQAVPAVRKAVSVTVMGNRQWRGVAEPLVNLTASLLGFRLVQSLSVVAEGPGEVLMDGVVADRLEHIGRALAGAGEASGSHKRSDVCPICKSDFFRIEPPSVVCPICGLAGELEAYAREKRFVATNSEERWGSDWLWSHIEAWVRPSVGRYRANRKKILRNLLRLKQAYAGEEERGRPDVQ